MRRGVVVFPAVIAIALSGCGGGGKSFEQKANDICKDFNKTQKSIGAPKSVAELKTYAPKVKAAFNDSLAKLRALDPPKDKAAQYKALLASGAAQVALFDQLVTAATTGDKEQVQAIAAQGDANNKKANAIAKSIGLDECAKGS